MDKNKYRDEINFKELLKNPIRLFGFVFPGTLLLIVVVGILYVKSVNDISFNDISKALPASVVITDLEMKKGATLPAVDLAIVKNAPVELIQKGRELYDATCSSCHGAKGLGDGSAGAALNPKPRNFTATSGWTNSRSMIGMYKTLQEGILKNGMAAYEYLIPEERLAILHYIRTLAEFPEITDSEVSDMDLTYGFSNEITTANQIPVKLAAEKIIAEGSKEITTVNYAINYVKYHEADIDKEIFEEYVVNLKRLATTLQNNTNLSDFNTFKTAVVNDPLNFGLNSRLARQPEAELKRVHLSFMNLISKSNIK
ncbi:MAG: cytochrome c [Bacteroidetes bacterium]|nr:cytochrome c [Bacteroidota bacterium]